MSGQQVSQEKTSIMFSKNVNAQLREELVTLSGYNATSSLGKYLGVPLVGRAPKCSDYNYLISQVKSKMSNWKAKQLSFAGRVTLSKAIIEAIPTYPMMTAAIPKTCLNEIQKIQRAFIWGDEDGTRRYHAVNWEKVTQPKAIGGLGIRRLVHMNQACLMKLAWAVRNGENALWIEVLKGKYSRGRPNFEQVSFKTQDSSLWKNLVNIWSNLGLYEFWSIGNSNMVKAWEDRWLLHGRSIQELGINIPDHMKNMLVADLIDNTSSWKIELLSSWLPANIISRLTAVVPPNNTDNRDQRAWIGTGTGIFTIASAYMLLCRFNDDDWNTDWVRIWKLNVPERVRSFMWLVRHDRLITNYRKNKMHIGDPWCNHCVDVVEDTLHVLRDCPLAKSVWCNLLNDEARDCFFTAALADWTGLNLRRQLGRNDSRNWSCVWATNCYYLWLWRNREVHGDARTRPTQPWNFILGWVQQYMEADVNKVVFPNNNKVEALIAWKCPEEGWLCLNTDGASRGEIVAGCGGLLRNSSGQWIGGFSKNLGRCNAYLAELWGVYEGLCLARNLGATKLKVLVDSSVVNNTLNGPNKGSVVGWRLIQEIRRLLALDWEVKVCHSYREANGCADALANMGCEHGLGIRVYDLCPPRLSSLLLADVMGIATSRIISF
jgi:ribonuclease HI